MSNWLANATGIHLSPKKAYINRDQMGNALKNLAPAAFLIPGVGPGAAAAIGGLGSAVGRGIQHGADFGDILGQAASGASIAYGGARGLEAARAAFTPGSSPASTIYSSGPNGGWTQTQGAVSGSHVPTALKAAGSGVKAAGGALKGNALVAGQVASGVIDARAQGAQTDLQRDALDFQKEQYNDQRDDQEARRRRLQEMLAPLLAGYLPAGGY